MSDKSSYIIFITIGPVGTFIAAGRRSRDLWFGSQWLSRATGRIGNIIDHYVIHHNGIEQPLDTHFIHPDATKLRSYGKPLKASVERSNRYVAQLQNKLIFSVDLPAQLSGDPDSAISDLIGDVYQQINREFSELIDTAIKNMPGGFSSSFSELVDNNSFTRQKKSIENGDFIQLFAGWELVTHNDDPKLAATNLVTARQAAIARAMERKHCRFFLQPTFSQIGRPKSHLDAGRDSILAEEPTDSAAAWNHHQQLRQLAGISHGEHLDAIGLARRLAVFHDKHFDMKNKLPVLPFPALARVALDPYIRGATKRCPDKLRDIHGILAKNENTAHNNLQAIAANWCIATPCYEPGRQAEKTVSFPWDAQLLMANGVETLEKELYNKINRPISNNSPANINDADKQTGINKIPRLTRNMLQHLNRAVKELQRTIGEPIPYYALIEFDGDGVGDCLKALSPDNYRTLAEAMDEFSSETAPKLDQRSISGCPFYIGGDEGLVFVPLSSLTETVKQISHTFNREVKPALANPASARLSLSFGVVVCHVKYDLRTARRLATEALESAKNSRQEANSDHGWIEVVELPRGGVGRRSNGPIEGTHDPTFAETTSAGSNYLHTLALLVDACDERALSGSTAHGLIELLARAGDRSHNANLSALNNSREKAVTSDSQSLHFEHTLLRAQALPLQKMRRAGNTNAKMSALISAQVNSWSATHHIENFANTLLLAEQISRVQQQAGPRGSTDGIATHV